MAFGLVSRTCCAWPQLTSSCGEAWFGERGRRRGSGSAKSQSVEARVGQRKNVMTFVVAVACSNGLRSTVRHSCRAVAVVCDVQGDAATVNVDGEDNHWRETMHE